MKRILTVLMVLLLFVVSAFVLTSCWIGGDYTPKQGAGTVNTQPPPTAESPTTASSSDTSSTQPQEPADTSDDDESDIFGD